MSSDGSRSPRSERGGISDHLWGSLNFNARLPSRRRGSPSGPAIHRRWSKIATLRGHSSIHLRPRAFGSLTTASAPSRFGRDLPSLAQSSRPGSDSYTDFGTRARGRRPSRRTNAANFGTCAQNSKENYAPFPRPSSPIIPWLLSGQWIVAGVSPCCAKYHLRPFRYRGILVSSEFCTFCLRRFGARTRRHQCALRRRI